METCVCWKIFRFHPGEAVNDLDFSKALASQAECYINDAFGTSHRDAASMTGVPRALGSGAAGYLVQKEVEIIHRALHKPARPFSGRSGRCQSQ